MNLHSGVLSLHCCCVELSGQRSDDSGRDLQPARIRGRGVHKYQGTIDTYLYNINSKGQAISSVPRRARAIIFRAHGRTVAAVVFGSSVGVADGVYGCGGRRGGSRGRFESCWDDAHHDEERALAWPDWGSNSWSSLSHTALQSQKLWRVIDRSTAGGAGAVQQVSTWAGRVWCVQASRRLRRSAQANFQAMTPTKCPAIGVPGVRAKVDSACSFGGCRPSWDWWGCLVGRGTNNQK